MRSVSQTETLRFFSQLRGQFHAYILVLGALAWCGFLLALRCGYTRTLDYGFLFWNLGLAFAPLFFSTILLTQTSLLARLFLGALWLLFFPNAPYLITDLMHLRTVTSGPIWLDILLLTSSAATGLGMGFLSLYQIQNQIEKSGRPILAWALAISSLTLAGFGIYIGRFLRWHSVDLFLNPFHVINAIADRILHPLIHTRTWGVTLGFATFLILAYVASRTINRAPKQRSQ
jgi:uncharacterized membrane protein